MRFLLVAGTGLILSVLMLWLVLSVTQARGADLLPARSSFAERWGTWEPIWVPTASEVLKRLNPSFTITPSSGGSKR